MADDYECKEPEPDQPTLPSGAIAGKHIAAGTAIAVVGGWLLLSASAAMQDLVNQFVGLFEMNLREDAPQAALVFTIAMAVCGTTVGLLVAIVRAQRNRLPRT